MNLRKTLKTSKSLDLSHIFNVLQMEEITEEINKIIRSNQKFRELRNDEQYKQNFLDLISYLYLTNTKKNINTDKSVPIKIDKKIFNRLKELDELTPFISH